MNHIKKLIIKNFQSHKHSEIEFDPYLNVIIGPSDQGKSAIIRALKWALFNEPSGDFFIREGETECSVTVVFNNEVIIKRFRSKNKNAYYLYNALGEEMVFEGFGTSVPKEIRDMISVRKVDLDNNLSNLINISEQLEGPFLLSEKNSTKANAIGRIVGVHIIDNALQETLKDIRNLNIKRKNHDNILDGLKENLNKYDYLDKLNKDFEQLKGIKQNIYNQNIRLKNISVLSTNLNHVNTNIKSTRDTLQKLNKIDQITKIENTLEDKIKFLTYIKNKRNLLKNINKQINYNTDLFDSLQGIDRAYKKISNIEKINTKLDKLTKSMMKYNKLMENINKYNKVLDATKSIDSVDDKIKLVGNKFSTLANLMDLQIKRDQVNKSMAIGANYINKFARIKDGEKIYSSLNLKSDRIKQLKNYKNDYDAIQGNKERIEDTFKRLDIQIESLLKQYEDILVKIKICPICFGKIDNLKIEEILNSYK